MSFARLLKHTHLGLTGFWLLNAIAVVVIFVKAPDLWKQLSVLYLVIVSIYANMATHWGAWQGSRAEVRVEETQQVSGEQVTVQQAGHVDQVGHE